MLLAGHFTTSVFPVSFTHLNSDLQDFTLLKIWILHTAVSTNHILPYKVWLQDWYFQCWNKLYEWRMLFQAKSKTKIRKFFALLIYPDFNPNLLKWISLFTKLAGTDRYCGYHPCNHSSWIQWETYCQGLLGCKPTGGLALRFVPVCGFHLWFQDRKWDDTFQCCISSRLYREQGFIPTESLSLLQSWGKLPTTAAFAINTRCRC